MGNTANQNIILSKIDKLRTLFLNEVEKGKQVVVCDMKYLDIDVVDAFCLTEDSEYGKLDDIIISCRAPIRNYNEYSPELVKELLDSYETTKGFAGENPWVLKDWDTSWLDKEKDKRTPLIFFKLLESLMDAVPDFDAKVFAFLSPNRIENNKHFTRWIDEALALGIPLRCGILVVQNSDDPFLTAIAGKYPKNASVIYPDLRMDQAIKQMATAGKPTDPDVQFRKCFFNMQDGVAKNDASHIGKWRDKAREIATRMAWKDMVVTTDLAAGTFMLHVKQTTKAIDYYNQAIESGHELIDANPSLGKPYTIQAMAAKGAALLSLKNYREAIPVYEQLAGMATESKDFSNAMEGWRMAGFSYKAISQRRKAYECYKNALEVAEGMSPDLRPHTTLPYVGMELFELAPADDNKAEALEEIDRKMKQYVGDGWKNRYK